MHLCAENLPGQSIQPKPWMCGISVDFESPENAFFVCVMKKHSAKLFEASSDPTRGRGTFPVQ
ncbi:MAG: hypothetical protein Greene101449_534 [Candidatus Peregrinibacteria bacterium Greene1014_49]|nr:MAG: hypothetical protein Greene101449_534 [Candidatus Peregrinibacteria bacterium Greene1014_49]